MADQPVQSPPNPNAWRADLRRARLVMRQSLPAEAHAQASARICAALLGLLQSHPAGRVAFCWPVRGEVDCRPLVGQLLALGWQACMPTVVSRAAPMVFRPWTPASEMAADPHGIPVPAAPECAPPDVILLPLVAFDAANYRLGYGGGYFDRTLAILSPRPLTIGVGFEHGRVATIYPAAHDIPLDRIVTEAVVQDAKSHLT